MRPSAGDTICGEVRIEAEAAHSVGAEAFGPLLIARQGDSHELLWLTVIERTLVPDQESLSRFMAGANALVDLRHRGLTKVTLVDREADFCVVGCKVVPGAVPLRDLPESERSSTFTARVAAEVARGLAFLHRRGRVHGALNDGNILFREGTLRMTQHGLAELCEPSRLLPRLRKTGGFPIPLEVANGNPVDATSDVFAWGVVVAQLATSREGADAVAAVLDDELPATSLSAVVKLALCSDPAERPADAVALLERLASMELGTEVAAEDAALRELAGRYLEELDAADKAAASGDEPPRSKSPDGRRRAKGTRTPRQFTRVATIPDPPELAPRTGEIQASDEPDPDPFSVAIVPRTPGDSENDLRRSEIPAETAAPEAAASPPRPEPQPDPEPELNLPQLRVPANRDFAADELTPPESMIPGVPPTATPTAVPPPAVSPPRAKTERAPAPPPPVRSSAAAPSSPPTGATAVAKIAVKPRPPTPEPKPELHPPPPPVAEEILPPTASRPLPSGPRPGAPLRLDIEGTAGRSAGRRSAASQSGIGLAASSSAALLRAPPSFDDRVGLGPGGASMAALIALLSTLLAVGLTVPVASARGGFAEFLGLRAHSPEPPPSASEGDDADAGETPSASDAKLPAVLEECPAEMAQVGKADAKGRRLCIDLGEHPGLREVPTVDVSLAQARQACVEQGKRLCTTKEWRRACKGPKGHRFPYGSSRSADRCNDATERGVGQNLSRSGARDGCVTPTGVFDLVGNVGEWVEDGVVLGGDATARAPNCGTRAKLAAETSGPSTGFRCCADAGPASD